MGKWATKILRAMLIDRILLTFDWMPKRHPSRVDWFQHQVAEGPAPIHQMNKRANLSGVHPIIAWFFAHKVNQLQCIPAAALQWFCWRKQDCGYVYAAGDWVAEQTANIGSKRKGVLKDYDSTKVLFIGLHVLGMWEQELPWSAKERKAREEFSIQTMDWTSWDKKTGSGNDVNIYTGSITGNFCCSVCGKRES